MDMGLKEELEASLTEGGAGVMMLVTEGGVKFVGLDSNGEVIELDNTQVTYGGESGLRYTDTEGE